MAPLLLPLPLGEGWGEGRRRVAAGATPPRLASVPGVHARSSLRARTDVLVARLHGWRCPRGLHAKLLYAARILRYARAWPPGTPAWRGWAFGLSASWILGPTDYEGHSSMEKGLISVLLGVIAGTAGYWFTTFWMKPILQYRELRSKVFADLIFYAQVVNADGLNERMQKLFDERVLSNRRHAAELAACVRELPAWYKWWLHRRGQSPEKAARHLIGYSNTTDFDHAEKRETAIRKALGFESAE